MKLPKDKHPCLYDRIQKLLHEGHSETEVENFILSAFYEAGKNNKTGNITRENKKGKSLAQKIIRESLAEPKITTIPKNSRICYDIPYDMSVSENLGSIILDAVMKGALEYKKRVDLDPVHKAKHFSKGYDYRRADEYDAVAKALREHV